MPIVEYPAGSPFPGVIGRTADESSPAWPAITRAPKGAPNVLFVVLDDTPTRPAPSDCRSPRVKPRRMTSGGPTGVAARLRPCVDAARGPSRAL
jgi:hypothetical protein